MEQRNWAYAIQFATCDSPEWSSQKAFSQTMMRSLVASLVAVLLLLVLPARAQPLNASSPSPSFADFDRRARNGERLDVVFFGASLTWGANASDPLLTSYRALTGRRLQRHYPDAHFTFWDGAIGGTGSQLGVFRFDRDVLRHKPDLVFLDFSANDGINGDDEETLASYESLVRRVITEAKCPLVQVIFPFQWDVQSADLEKMKRRTAHLAIARHYNTVVGDAIQLAIERIKSGETTLQKIWPIDGVHPGDTGYELFADAAWSALRKGVAEKVVCRAPAAMLHSDKYMTRQRARISRLGALPTGWKVGYANRVAAYFDFTMSRWLDDEVIAAPGAAPLELKFRGQMVMLLGETTLKSGAYRIEIDGQPLENAAQNKAAARQFDAGEFARKIGGNGHYTQILATDLAADVTHTLVIEPLLEAEQELRLESICVAGGAARVESFR